MPVPAGRAVRKRRTPGSAALTGPPDLRCLAGPINPGELMLIPKQHIDHFCDVPDALAARIMTLAQRFARSIRRELEPLRVGLVVHGFGVPHAHLIVVPQHCPTDITSSRFAYLNAGQIEYGIQHVPEVPRGELDLMAASLSGQPLSWVRRDRGSG